jgi:hypothetical protein
MGVTGKHAEPERCLSCFGHSKGSLKKWSMDKFGSVSKELQKVREKIEVLSGHTSANQEDEQMLHAVWCRRGPRKIEIVSGLFYMYQA